MRIARRLIRNALRAQHFVPSTRRFLPRVAVTCRRTDIARIAAADLSHAAANTARNVINIAAYLRFRYACRCVPLECVLVCNIAPCHAGDAWVLQINRYACLRACYRTNPS